MSQTIRHGRFASEASGLENEFTPGNTVTTMNSYLKPAMQLATIPHQSQSLQRKRENNIIRRNKESLNRTIDSVKQRRKSTLPTTLQDSAAYQPTFGPNPWTTDTRPSFLGGNYTSKINSDSQHMHTFMFSKERGDRATLNQDCKKLF